MGDPGPQGPIGFQGMNGTNGLPGPPGANGSSIDVTGVNLYANCTVSNSSCVAMSMLGPSNDLSCATTPPLTVPVSLLYLSSVTV